MNWDRPTLWALRHRTGIPLAGPVLLAKRAAKALIAITAAGMLWGCGLAAETDGSSGVDTPGITPTGGVIASSTIENVALLHTFSGHGGRVLDVVVSPQGDLIASSSQDLTIRLWDTGSGQEVHHFRMMSVDMADIDVTRDGCLLASAETIWSLEDLQEIHAIERGSAMPAHVAFSPDGSTLAVGRFDQEIQLWNVTSGDPVFSLAEQDEVPTKSMQFSPDGAALAAGVHDGRVMFWDVGRGEIINTLHYPGETDIHDVAFSPDGAYLASAGRVPAVILWSVDRGEPVRTFGVRDTVLSLAFSPDGTILAAAAGAERAIRLWDVESGDLLRSLAHDDQVSAIAFSPDGRYLVAGGFDSNVYLWGVPSNP
jgi:WD40 repeat protein